MQFWLGRWGRAAVACLKRQHEKGRRGEKIWRLTCWRVGGLRLPTAERRGRPVLPPLLTFSCCFWTSRRSSKKVRSQYGDPDTGDRRHVRQGVRRAHRPSLFQGHARPGDAASRPVPGRRGDRDRDDDRQPRPRRARPRRHRPSLPRCGGNLHRHHARHRHDGRDRAGAGHRRARRQDDRADRRHGALRLRQLGRSVQSGQRAVVRAGPAVRGLRCHERTALPVGPGAQEHGDWCVRGGAPEGSACLSPLPRCAPGSPPSARPSSR